MGNVTAKTSGEIASFMTPAKTNIKSLKVHFSPKQLGTGDPSPENVREIEGWGGVEINGSGRNLLQNANGSLSYLYLKKGTTITISQSMDSNVGYFRGYDVNKVANTPLVWINQKNNGKRIWSEYTLEDDIYYAVCYTGTGMKEAQITIDGSVDFKPYQGNNISYQWKLPDEYQEVEYIESTGTQYIELPFGFDRTDEIETRFTVREGNVTYASDKYIVSPNRWNNNNNRFAMGLHSASGFINCYCIGFGQRSTAATFLQPTTESDFGMHTWTFKDDVFSIEELGLSLDVASVSFGSTTYPLKLFYGYNANTAGKIAYYKHKKINGDLYNLIPCYRKSDGEIGMYDIANNVFYTNQGTGTFLKGEDVDKTFYGGYVDLISGELVEEYNFVNIDYSNSWGTTTNYLYRNDNLPPSIGGRNMYVKTLCSHRINPYDVTAAIAVGTQGTIAVGKKFCEMANIEMTSDAFNQYLESQYNNGTPLQICYLLKTPITHQLTPTQLSSFIGQNNFWSNADYVEIEYELKETEDIQKVRKKIILNQPHIESINGDIASFTTNMKAPLKECKVYFNPIQEGSGDPSPDNVRNIVGWDGVNVGLPDEYQEVEYIESTGTQYIKTDIKSRPIIKYESILEFTNGSDQYTVGFRDGNFRASGNGYYSNKTQIAYNTTYKLGARLSLNKKYKYKTCLKPNEQNVFLDDEMVASYDLPQTETVLSDKHVGIFCQLSNDTTPQFLSKIKLTSLVIKENDLLLGNFVPCYRKSDGEIGMYDTVSKTFYTNSGTGTFLKGDDVNTIIGNVSWSDEVGTVYGGYVDLVKGELVAEYFGFIADGENIKTNRGYVNDTSYGAGIVYMDRYGFPDSDRLRVNTYCNTLNPIRSASQNCVYWATNGGFYLVFSPFSKTTEESKASSEALEETNEWLKQHPTQIVYKLRTPIRYQLTPQQLLTFKGENNIWSDTNGQTEVKFWTH